MSIKLHCDAKGCEKTRDIKKGSTDVTDHGWFEVIHRDSLKNFHSGKCVKAYIVEVAKEEDKRARAQARRDKKWEEERAKSIAAEAARIAKENEAITQPTKKPARKKAASKRATKK